MKWIKCEDKIPKLKDDSVLVYWGKISGLKSAPAFGSIETVHIEDYFSPISAGLDKKGNRVWTRWYKSQGVTHWMELPDPPAG